MPKSRAQRRLAAILAADVVGYSRLMGDDEEGTLTRLKECRAEIVDPSLARYGGRIVKVMGDGVLVEFASAVDAVQSALDVQVGMAERNSGAGNGPRMRFRVGVHLADVIVEDEDIHGDGVNITSRLEGLSEPGGICVSDDVYRQVRGKVDAAFDDLGPQQVKNIASPIHAYAVRPADAHLATAPPLPDKPSIAVLAFDNMSGDREQEYFADGIAEDIITALSRFNWFFVIARNSSFSYKGTSPDLRQVGKELGVQYVLEGSVRKSGNRVRISAQLIEAMTGRHIWADRYDRELEDIFALQDEITEAITGAVAPAFVSAEARRSNRKASENLDIWDLVMRGNWCMWRLGREDIAEGQRLFERAVAIEPDSSIAQTGLALAYLLEAGAGWAVDIKRNCRVAMEATRTALARDGQDAMAHAAHAMALHISRDNRAAADACSEALELNPNLAFAEGLLGLIQAHLGDYDEANRHLDNVQRLSPRDSTLGLTNMARVVSSLVAGRDEEYLERAKAFTKTSPDFVAGWRHIAAAYAILGRLDEARAAMEQVFKLSPDDCLESIRRDVPIVHPDAQKKYLGALLDAGLPE